MTKSCGAGTTSVNGALCVPLVNCSVRVPAFAPGATATFTSCGTPGFSVNVAGVKTTSGVDGDATVIGIVAVDDTVTLPFAPAASVSSGGVAVSVKSAGAGIVNVNGAVCVPLANCSGRVPGVAFGATVTVTVCGTPGLSVNVDGVKT